LPKLERLSWVVPLSEGRGVTLTDDPAADRFLAENPNALLLGVLYDSQYLTRKAFAVPLRLRERLGHLDMTMLASEDRQVLNDVFSQKPALHRFPYKFAGMTQELARVVTSRYGGDASRIWMEATNTDDLGQRLIALPAFGEEKTNWTVGMLGQLGLLDYDDWLDYRVTVQKRKRP
jgi:uncharacterized HhH-GPD family protein